MSNEELVAAGRLAELWDNVEKLVRWKAKRIMTALELRGCSCGVEFEDLYQSGYLAMVAAADGYRPENGAFSTWFMYHLKNAFAEATGYRTKSGQNEPLNAAVSLDKPLTDEANSRTFGEMVPDAKESAALEAVEDREYRRQLHEALEEALEELPQQSAEVLRLRHYQDLTLADIGEMRGASVERIRQMENKALRKLREPAIICRLRPFIDFDFYGGTGLRAFQHSGTSIQERYLVIEEERRKLAESRRKERESRRRKEQLRSAWETTLEQIRQEAEEQVRRMSQEERDCLLRRYGLLEPDKT